MKGKIPCGQHKGHLCDTLNCCMDLNSERNRQADKQSDVIFHTLSVEELPSCTHHVTEDIVGSVTTDNVDQPQHYARWPMQPIEFISINKLPYWLGNVLKYAMRYDAKNGLEDLYKARSYLDMEIRRLEGHGRYWEAPVATERKLNGR